MIVRHARRFRLAFVLLLAMCAAACSSNRRLTGVDPTPIPHADADDIVQLIATTLSTDNGGWYCAVKAICGRADAEVGDLGILFFQHMIAQAPEEKIRVKLHSGLLRLTMRGWLGVLAHGGPRVVGWMAQKGLKGPGAVAAAISKLKK